MLSGRASAGLGVIGACAAGALLKSSNAITFEFGLTIASELFFALTVQVCLTFPLLSLALRSSSGFARSADTAATGLELFRSFDGLIAEVTLCLPERLHSEPGPTRRVLF